MKIRHAYAVSLTLLAPTPCTIAQELQATAQLYPPLVGAKTPTVLASSDDATLVPRPNNLWDVERNDEKKALAKAAIAFDTQPPPEYKSQSVQVRIPYMSEGPIKVTLFAVNVDDSPRRVREIFGTTITAPSLSTRELYRLYQETAYISKRKLADIEQQPSRSFFWSDAQIFFKYLEIARELGRRVNLIMSAEVLAVQTYLRTQAGLQEGRNVLDTAIPSGTQDVLRLIEEIDFVDAEQLRKLWHTMENQPDAYSEKACNGYRAFLTTVAYDFDDSQVKRWSEHKDYNMVKLVTDRLNFCIPRESVDEVRASANVIQAIESKAFVSGEIERSVDSLRRAIEMRF